MRFLVAIDGPQVEGKTTRTARRLARVFEATPVLCHVISLKRLQYKDIPDFQVDMIKEQTRKTGQRILQDGEKLMESEGIHAEARLLFGEAGATLQQEYDSGDYQLSVVGSRGKPEIKELLFGSLSSYLVYHSRKPVLVVKGGIPDTGDRTPLNVLVAIDNSGAARRALTFLEHHGDSETLDLTFLNVVNPDTLGLEPLSEEDRRITREEARKESRAFLEVKAERFTDKGFEVKREVAEGNPGDEIITCYRDGGYEMLVVGRSDYKEFGDFVHDSVCHHVARHHPVNILLVP